MIYDLHRFEEIPSTNDWIRERIGRVKPGTVCPAERQTQGRGRHGRPWSTGAGENLAFSVLLDWPDSQRPWSGLAQAAGLCLAKVLRSENLPALLKWPNDVTVGGKKIAGILVESVEHDNTRFFILGIGLNVNAEPEFLNQIDQRATSMRASAGKSFDREVILQKILDGWSVTYSAFQSSGFVFFMDEWKNLSSVEGRRIVVKPASGEHYRAEALRILFDGGLEVKTELGEIRSLASGEIEWT